MSDRRRIFLILIMLSVVLIVSGISITMLYQAAFSEEKARLVETAQSQARLMESIARFDAIHSQDYPGGPIEATLSQINNAHENYVGFGQTGEFTLAKQEGDLIIFLLRHRHLDTDIPQPVPFESELAEPMRQALSNQSGTLVGLDYRGETVLAAYEPIAELDMGIVAKIDLVEIRAPFFRAGIIAGAVTLTVAFLGALLFFRITEPLLQNIRDNEEKLRGFMEAATEAFFLFDEELNYSIINEVGMSFFPPEIRSEDTIGTNILDVAPSLKETGRYEQYKKVIETGEPFFADDVVPDPKFGDAYLTIRAFKVGDGLGMTITDITERKQAEVERENLISEMEAKNAELERFTYTVSHDLKSPLITIGGFLGYLEKDAVKGDTEKLKGDIQRINNAVGKMQRLLDELLELSRIGRLMNPPKEVPFEEIVRDALEQVEGQLSESKIKVQVGNDLPVVYGDRVRLVEVVQNLVDNSIKFMGDQPQPSIEVGVSKQNEKHIFFVKDNGEGIEPQYHDKIFELFDKLDPTSEGTGIGLALVKRIVNVHKGEIWVESQGKGTGTAFYFTLPQEPNASKPEVNNER